MQAITAIIDRCALRYNLKILRKLVHSSKIVAIVKANAYGHGLIKIAQTLSDVDAFGVARLEEAIQLREKDITQPILLLGGFFSTKDIATIVNYKIQVTVHNKEQLEKIERANLCEPISVWMKLDTGMHRLGIRQEYAEIFYQNLMNCKNIKQPINIISHFAYANDLEYSATEQQLNNFNAFCKGKSGLRSIAASSGILLWPKSHFDWTRPGIILYGISPIKHRPWGLDLGFQPVMSLISSLIAVREHKAGEPVGYGGTWISKRDTFIGVVAAGYGDGYPYAAQSGTPVIINNREVIIVGRVNMDTICIDLGPQARDKVGDTVTLWGNGLPVERISQKTGISVYELVASLTSRVSIRYVN